MSPVEVATVLKEAVLAGVGVATVTLAALGLSTWHRQLRGHADFDAARNLAKATYAVRNALAAARSPVIWAGEFPDDYIEMTANEYQRAAALSHVYSERWKPVSAAMHAFDAAALEAEALWGATARLRTEALRKCLPVLSSAMEALVDNVGGRGQSFRTDPEFGRKVRVEAHSKPDNTDELSKQIRNAVTGIEDLLKPHLVRS